MLVQLQPDQYSSVYSIFETLSFNIEILSILKGNTRGQVFVDDLAHPCCALAWDRLATLFVAGIRESEPDDVTGPFAAALRAWTCGIVLPQAQRWGIPDLTFVHNSPSWQAHLSALFSDYEVDTGRRYHYIHTGSFQPTVTLPSGYTLQAIDAALLEREDMPGMGWLREWILSFWFTPEAFLERGLGYVILASRDQNCSNQEAIVSLCISVFVSGTAHEFGTATQDPYQRQGLSTAVTRACVNACHTRNLSPIWQCWVENAASVAVARKTGFELEREYEVLRLRVPTPDNADTVTEVQA